MQSVTVNLVTITQAQLEAALEKKQEAAREAQSVDLDPAHYPLRFQLLKGEFTPANSGYNGFGRGDLFYQDKSVKGIEFSSHGFRLIDSLGNEAYRARLNDTSDKLYLLVHVIGENGENSYRQCELKINVKLSVFVKTITGLTTMSQEEFARMRKAREQKQALSVASNAATNPQ